MIDASGHKLRGAPSARGEALLAVAASGALGVLVAAYSAGIAFVAGALAAYVAVRLARITWRAAALVLVILGHTASGQLYVLGWLPETFAVVLDLLVGMLCLTVLLGRRRTMSLSQGLVLGFVALAVLQLFNPLVPSFEYGILGLRQIALTAVVLLTVRNLPLTARDLGFVLAALGTGWAVNVLVALRQWLGSFSAQELRWIEDLGSTYLVEDQIRLLGAMQSTQDFAFMAAIATPVVAVLAFRARTTAARVAFGALSVASVAVLFGSLMRSGLVAGLVGVAVALIAAAHDARQRRRLALAGLVALGVLWPATFVVPTSLLPEDKAQTLERRVLSLLAPTEDLSFRERQEAVWPAVIRQIAAHPLGAGPGSAGPLTQARPYEAPLGRIVPDNGYLLVGVQMGIAGIAIFVAMLLALGAELWRRARAGGAIAAAALGSVAAAMTAMLAGNYWSLVAPGVMLGVVVALGLRDEPEPGFG